MTRLQAELSMLELLSKDLIVWPKIMAASSLAKPDKVIFKNTLKKLFFIKFLQLRWFGILGCFLRCQRFRRSLRFGEFVTYKMYLISFLFDILTLEKVILTELWGDIRSV